MCEVWAPDYELLARSRNPGRTKRSNDSLKFSFCTFGTGYCLKHIGFTSYFNANSTESFFQVPSVTSNNSSNFYNNFSNSFHCTSVRCWNWFSITLFKYELSYLEYKITRNHLVEVRTCSYLYNSTA